MSIGKKISELRTKKGLNKSDLANRLGISHVQIIRYERDESIPTTDKIQKLADIFGVTADYLLNNKSKNSESRSFGEKELETLMQLPDDYKALVIEYAEFLSKRYKKKRNEIKSS